MPPRKRAATQRSPARGIGKKRNRRTPVQLRERSPPRTATSWTDRQAPAEGQSQPPEEAPQFPMDSTPDNPGESCNFLFGQAAYLPLPCQITSTCDDIGSHVPLKFKQKIWEGFFIDLSVLLKSATELEQFESHGDLQLVNGKLCVVKRQLNSFLTIEKWTSAFMIYMSIVLQHSQTAQEMLKYMRNIRLAANRSPNWHKYDEQFRLRKASNPAMSWGEIHSEFWLMYINQSNVTTQQSAQAKFKPQASTNSFNTTSVGHASQNQIKFCNSYNSGKSCNFFPRCRYSHSCSQCRGKHPRVNCRN
ncbi:uncharacterized protein LOC130053477 [Ostrea edulis]|uniref:uncharacterized protein LOC130053477 n=1 Tax=Ostrea edulis TaxID=37623 RepID=UPI0024AF50E4|nr:uncharacterized protein LOC130053477 [Ostrea edulis]